MKLSPAFPCATGMIEWIVGQLEEVENLSDYSIEYGTALLMNLSLRQAGKLR